MAFYVYLAFAVVGGITAVYVFLRQRTSTPENKHQTTRGAAGTDSEHTGTIRSHTDLFKRYRQDKTIRLLARLQKLMEPTAPTNPRKRKEFERSVGHWIPDEEARTCKICDQRFGITKRRHHCRLCDSVACSKCSRLLSHSFAYKLTNQARTGNPNVDITSPQTEQYMRVCKCCYWYLERQDRKMEQSEDTEYPFCLMYEELMVRLNEAKDLLSIAQSLRKRDQHYIYTSVSVIRTKLSNLAADIDEKSRCIRQYGVDIGRRPNASQLRLQNSIRMYIKRVIEDLLECDSTLPTEEEFRALQEKHKARIQQEYDPKVKTE